MLAEADALLRAEGRYAATVTGVPWRRLLVITVVGAFIYDFDMGLHGGRGLQAVYSGLKVPLLLAVATLLCLPSFYVINALLGLRADFAAACRGVLASQAVLAVALCAFAPIVPVVYLSIDNYRAALLWNGFFFALAAGAGQIALARRYRILIRSNPRHRIARAAWGALYVFAAIQMAWVLRPFVGAPNLPTRFFREDAWSNAYLEVWRIVRGVMGGE
jgi:hypothetical protein